MSYSNGLLSSPSSTTTSSIPGPPGVGFKLTEDYWEQPCEMCVKCTWKRCEKFTQFSQGFHMVFTYFSTHYFTQMWKFMWNNHVKRAPHFHKLFHSMGCETPCERACETFATRQTIYPVKMDVKIKKTCEIPCEMGC